MVRPSGRPMRNIETYECYNYLNEKFPLCVRACRPRIIDVPNGWADPKWFSINMASALSHSHMISDTAMANNLINTVNLVRYGVPTYFVMPDLAEAAWLSTPPLDLPLHSIKWPMPAMLFILPDSFLEKHVHHYIPYLAITKAPRGVYPDDIINFLPKVEKDWKKFTHVETDVDRILFWYPRFGSPNNLPIDYNGAFRDLFDGVAADEDVRCRT